MQILPRLAAEALVKAGESADYSHANYVDDTTEADW